MTQRHEHGVARSPIRTGRTLATLAVAAIACFAATACEYTEIEARPPRMTHGAATLSELGDSIWRAVVAADTAALRRMRVTEREHNQIMWPEMPASAPDANFPVAFAWRNIETRGRAALADLLSAYRGASATLGDVRCDGEPRLYDSFHALTDCALLLVDPDGAERRLQAFRHVVVMDNRYKVVRYYGDE